MSSPGSRTWLWGGGGAVLREGRHIDNECMRSQGRIQDLSKRGNLDPRCEEQGDGGGAVRFRPHWKSHRYSKLSMENGKARGGGGVCAVRFRSDAGGGGGGGRSCVPYDDTMIYIFVCVRVRDSAGGGGGGGGGNWCQRAAFHMNWGGGGGELRAVR